MRIRVAFLLVLCFLVWTYASYAESTFTTKGCEYSVRFPSQPKYKTGFDPRIGEYTQAQYSAGSKADGFFLRAECIATGDIRNAEINSKEFLQQHIVAYAESNGLQNPEYHYGENELGKYVHVRGFKTIDGVPVTYEAYTYVGDTSFVSLYADGASSSYPQNPVHSFFKSLRRTGADEPITPGNFVNLSFPQGVSVAVPRNWDFLDENLRANLRTFAEATVRIAGLMYPQGVETTLVAANGYSSSKSPSATMRLTVVAGKTVSQQEVQRLTQHDLFQLGQETKRILEVMFTKAERPQRIEWIGTRVEPHQGFSVLVHEYYRQPVGQEKVFVQMHILFLGDKEVKLTLSRSAAEQIWIPILKHIKSSWKVDTQ
jgi:hypothetical protein